VDPATGARFDVPVPLLRFSLGYEVGGGAAWATDLAPDDPQPNTRFGQDRLQRYDLGSGQLSVWLYRPGHPLAVQGWDGRRPIVRVADVAGTQVTHEVVMVLDAPNTGSVIWEADHGSGGWTTSTDDHGIWLLGQEGIFLTPPGGRAQLVSTLKTGSGIAGSCLG